MLLRLLNETLRENDGVNCDDYRGTEASCMHLIFRQRRVYNYGRWSRKRRRQLRQEALAEAETQDDLEFLAGYKDFYEDYF